MTMLHAAEAITFENVPALSQRPIGKPCYRGKRACQKWYHFSRWIRVYVFVPFAGAFQSLCNIGERVVSKVMKKTQSWLGSEIRVPTTSNYVRN